MHCADVTEQEIDGRIVRDTFTNGVRYFRGQQAGYFLHAAESQGDPERYGLDQPRLAVGILVEVDERLPGHFGHDQATSFDCPANGTRADSEDDFLDELWVFR
ncbi:hypothetical protein ACLVWQ_22185 [Streptomyces sp. CWNU-52B]|uniref:hypothetical protein n=1 Tax=Streptomyces sp. CWNU-52B TaxID=3394353 RepID=UPI0039BF56E9